MFEHLSTVIVSTGSYKSSSEYVVMDCSLLYQAVVTPTHIVEAQMAAAATWEGLNCRKV